MSSQNKKIAVVVGVGPGIGAAVAQKFASQQYSIALISRSIDKLTPVEKHIKDNGGHAISIPADAGNTQSLIDAFNKIKSELGNPTVLIYNAGGYIQGRENTHKLHIAIYIY